MYFWIDMISVIEVNTLLRMIMVSPMVHNKPPGYFMGEKCTF